MAILLFPRFLSPPSFQPRSRSLLLPLPLPSLAPLRCAAVNMSPSAGAAKSSSRRRDNDGAAILWFKRDLRVDDHPGLAAAAASNHRTVIPLYIFDHRILSQFPSDTLMSSQTANITSALNVTSLQLTTTSTPNNIYISLPRKELVTVKDGSTKLIPWSSKIGKKSSLLEDNMKMAKEPLENPSMFPNSVTWCD